MELFLTMTPQETVTPKLESLLFEELLHVYRTTRQESLELIRPLSTEDCQIQSMPDASPVKWHLAHSSWFFETFILKKFVPQYRDFSPQFDQLFNSYYNAIGEQFSRPSRGVLSRPSLGEVIKYREHIDQFVAEFLLSESCTEQALALLEIGIQHEKQHQELILTDLLHGFSQNPILPPYSETAAIEKTDIAILEWFEFSGGLTEIGASKDGFSYDNERPVHKHYLEPFKLASRPVSNGEYLEFIQDGGYRRSDFWLSDGWELLNKGLTEGQKEAPLYWQKQDESWYQFSLAGLQKLNPNQPACHLNYFEANAFAAWSGKRLPTEFEWERASHTALEQADYLDLSTLQPGIASQAGLSQMFGGVWEWTASSYLGYPGFKPFTGDAGEYNGKFMSGQFVLRGGSCVSPESHIRSSYRNFFYPHQSWQFSGVRLAEDI
jgi:ergothioneine biosynthesis protein EgtB